jgi:hypothetical protein
MSDLSVELRKKKKSKHKLPATISVAEGLTFRPDNVEDVNIVEDVDNRVRKVSNDNEFKIAIDKDMLNTDISIAVTTAVKDAIMAAKEDLKNVSSDEYKWWQTATFAKFLMTGLISIITLTASLAGLLFITDDNLRLLLAGFVGTILGIYTTTPNAKPDKK